MEGPGRKSVRVEPPRFYAIFIIDMIINILAEESLHMYVNYIDFILLDTQIILY